MKRIKKMAGLLLALIMVLSLSMPAFAAQQGALTGGSITVKDAVVGQEYSVYQIMYLESYNKDANAYAYKANSEWESWLKRQTAYVSFDDQGYVTWVQGASQADFAKAAQAYANTQEFESDSATVTATSNTVKFENLKLGYYLLDSTLGTLCSLDTTNPDVKIDEKNEVPSNVKTVEEDSTNQYGSVNDADIGQTVNYKSAITLPKGSENVVFHDKMSEGLTLDQDSIKVYTDAGMTTELDVANYAVKKENLTDGCTFEIYFTQNYLDSLNTEAKLYVKYAAVLNENAVVGGAGNTNESKLDYGDKSNMTTTPGSTTTTYTWSFDVLKYGNGDEGNVLEGAQFVLLNKDKTKVAVVKNGKFTGWENVPVAVEGVLTWPADTALTTDSNGKITISGLDADTYYLREIDAPDGYNLLAVDQEVVINPVNDQENQTLTLTPVTAKINNQSGNELPSTGGMGTRILYTVGVIFVVGAGVLLIVRRRMRAEK